MTIVVNVLTNFIGENSKNINVYLNIFCTYIKRDR